jgi:hypothetical protein
MSHTANDLLTLAHMPRGALVEHLLRAIAALLLETK